MTGPGRASSGRRSRGGIHASLPGPDADQAVAILYGAHHRALTQMAALLVNDIAAAEEIVQSAFVAMHGEWRRLGGGGQALAYLQRAVVRRARGRRPARPPLPARPLLDLGQNGQPDDATAEALILAALQGLPARQREALVLRYYADLPDARIASAMGISIRSASIHAERGRSRLRSVLESHHLGATHQTAGGEHPPAALRPARAGPADPC